MQSGIVPSEELSQSIFQKDYKFIEIKIQGEFLVLANKSNDLTQILTIKSISLILLHKFKNEQPNSTKTENAESNLDLETFLIQFVPEQTSIKDKMLYSASKQSITTLINYPIIQLLVTNTDELLHELLQIQSSTPLTESEIEMNKIKEQQISSAIGGSTKASNSAALQLEIAQEVIQVCTKLQITKELLVLLVPLV
jgi:hypothetical protein